MFRRGQDTNEAREGRRHVEGRGEVILTQNHMSFVRASGDGVDTALVQGGRKPYTAQ